LPNPTAIKKPSRSRTEPFAWQGFSLDLDEDWRPASLTGTRKQGYVRLEAGTHDLLQIRWETCKQLPSDIEARARGYMQRLVEMSKQRKDPIGMTRVHASENGADFKWRGSVKGAGRLFYEPDSKRVFIIERSGKRNDSIASEISGMLETFAVTDAWRVLGFEVRPPADLELEKFKFLTGRITLQFKSKRVDLTGERWGLADSILSKHSLTNWAKAVSDLTEVSEERNGLRLTGPAPIAKRALGFRAEALVRHDPDLNRLLVLRAVHKAHPPEWEWLP